MISANHRSGTAPQRRRNSKGTSLTSYRRLLVAAAWGVFVEASGLVCPLTQVENYFRVRAGEAAYEGDCLNHYLTATIYPDGLTRNIQFVLGALVLTVNLSVYLWLLRKRRT